ncbi:MAG: hypothetical protein M3R00_02405 [Pseudomonadota bacterium]|nr:hypothetical protein [Pseudomonadota bacterium]
MLRFSIITLVLFGAAASALAADQQDLAWPREIKNDLVNITLYQPQLEQLAQNNIRLNMTFSVQIKDANQPFYGALNAQCVLVTQQEKHIANCNNLKIDNIKFPAKHGSDTAVRAALNETLANKNLQFSYDQIQAGLRVTKFSERQHKTNFSFTPPKIYVVNQPTALIFIDSSPVMRQIKNTTLRRVINTPFVILFDTQTNHYFLRAGNTWQTTDDLFGEWQRTDRVPEYVAKTQAELKESNQGVTPIDTITATTTPATLIQITGPAKFASIPGTDLQYVQNSTAKIIKETTTERYFILISGRWYSSNSLNMNSEWTYVAGSELPVSFTKIPAGLSISDVLASVPGTLEAEEAVIRNQSPATKKLVKKTLALHVKYDGKPKFDKISGTNLEYVLNSDKPVIRHQNRFFANDNTVWFAADSTEGPWLVAEAIPEEIYDIPPNNPLYKLTYCYIFDADDESVRVGCTPGYSGSFVVDGVVIYGTGYQYIPWVGNEYYGGKTLGWAMEQSVWKDDRTKNLQNVVQVAELKQPAQLTKTKRTNVHRQHGKKNWQRQAYRNDRNRMNRYLYRQRYGPMMMQNYAPRYNRGYQNR